MKEYIYVLCYYHPTNEGEDAIPAFVHTKVYADSESDAYMKGTVWAGDTMPEFKGLFINDYVIEISQ